MKILWGVPIALALHNLEELFLSSSFLTSPAAERLPQTLTRHYDPVIFAIVLIAMAVIPFIVAMLGDLSNPRSPSNRFLLLLQAVMFTNVFWHAGIALTLRAYTPGLVTAVLCQLPFSLYLLTRAWRMQWVRRSTIVAVGSVALGLQALALIAVIVLK